MDLDLDAKRAERQATKQAEGRDVLTFRWNGTEYPLPPELPLTVLDVIGDIDELGTAAIASATKALIGEEAYAALLAGGATLDDLYALLQWAAEQYAGNLGNSAASPAS